MKLIHTIGLSLLSCSLLQAVTDVELDKKIATAGLKAIPSDQKEVMKLIDPNHQITEAKVALGQKLFFEPRLSKSGIISCNSCHNLGMGGVDGVAAAVGHKWTANPHHLNSPTVYNAVFFDAQFWDGRDKTLEEQAQGPMQAGPEMAAPKKLVEARINSMPAYVKAFQEAYGKDVKIDFKTITATIGLFERTLVTPSAYDDYLNGKKDALSSAEKEGLALFIDKGCTSCHTGIALGGSMQKFAVTGKYKFASIGDFKGDKNGMVKTATLRNITQTAPYFHNGAVSSLKEAIHEMGRIQLGLDLSKDELSKIETFLMALEGRKPEISYPQLPTSTEQTPPADFE